MERLGREGKAKVVRDPENGHGCKKKRQTILK